MPLDQLSDRMLGHLGVTREVVFQHVVDRLQAVARHARDFGQRRAGRMSFAMASSQS